MKNAKYIIGYNIELDMFFITNEEKPNYPIYKSWFNSIRAALDYLCFKKDYFIKKRDEIQEFCGCYKRHNDYILVDYKDGDICKIVTGDEIKYMYDKV